jgi:hypothetical protein
MYATIHSKQTARTRPHADHRRPHRTVTYRDITVRGGARVDLRGAVRLTCKGSRQILMTNSAMTRALDLR